MHARANPHESHQHHMTDGQHTQVLCHVNSCDNVQTRGHSTGAQHWLSERTMTAMAQRTQTLDVPWHTVEEQVARHTRCCKHDQRAADKARTCCAAAGCCPRPRNQDSILTVKAEFCAARGVGWEAVPLNSPPSCTCLPRSAHPRQKAVVPRISLVLKLNLRALLSFCALSEKVSQVNFFHETTLILSPLVGLHRLTDHPSSSPFRSTIGHHQRIRSWRSIASHALRSL